MTKTTLSYNTEKLIKKYHLVPKRKLNLIFAKACLNNNLELIKFLTSNQGLKNKVRISFNKIKTSLLNLKKNNPILMIFDDYGYYNSVNPNSGLSQSHTYTQSAQARSNIHKVMGNTNIKLFMKLVKPTTIKSFNYKIKRKNIVIKTKKKNAKTKPIHTKTNILTSLCEKDYGNVVQYLLSNHKYKVHTINTNKYLVTACIFNSIRTLQVFLDKNIGLNNPKIIHELKNTITTQGVKYFLTAVEKKHLLCNFDLKIKKTKPKL